MYKAAIKPAEFLLKDHLLIQSCRNSIEDLLTFIGHVYKKKGDKDSDPLTLDNVIPVMNYVNYLNSFLIKSSL